MNYKSPLLAVRFTSVCETPLNRHFAEELFLLAEETHQHFVSILNEVQHLKTESIEPSIKKRLFLFYGQLLNEVAGASFLLASHDANFPLFQFLRSAHEYVARAYYFSTRAEQTLEHFIGLDEKGGRLFRDTDIHPRVREQIERRQAEFKANNPKWKRPHDIGLKQILEALYGEPAAREMYATFHVFYSSFVHGHFDAVPNVIAFDGAGTSVKRPLPITNLAIVNMLRFMFSMTALMKRELHITSIETVNIYRRFVSASKPFGRARNPFPATLKMRGKI